MRVGVSCVGDLIYFYTINALLLMFYLIGVERFSSTKKKNPVSITVRSVGGVMNEIKKVKSSALYFKNGGVSTSLKVARLDLTTDQIVENISSVLKKMYTILDPKAVQIICMKTPDSVSLPLYECVRPSCKQPIHLITRPPASSVLIEAETDAFENDLTEATLSSAKRRKFFYV